MKSRVAKRGTFDGLVAQGGRLADVASKQLALPATSNVVPSEATTAV